MTLNDAKRLEDAAPVVDKTPSDIDVMVYKLCRHPTLRLDGEGKTVTCGECGKQLDPFWCLQQHAKDWKRALHDAHRILEAQKEIRQQRRDAKVKGHFFSRPQKPPAAIEAWDAFVAALGGRPSSMYRQGRQWMMEDQRGHHFSLEYCQEQAAR